MRYLELGTLRACSMVSAGVLVKPTTTDCSLSPDKAETGIRPLDEAHLSPAGGAQRIGGAGGPVTGEARGGIEQVEPKPPGGGEGLPHPAPDPPPARWGRVSSGLWVHACGKPTHPVVPHQAQLKHANRREQAINGAWLAQAGCDGEPEATPTPGSG